MPLSEKTRETIEVWLTNNRNLLKLIPLVDRQYYLGFIDALEAVVKAMDNN